MNPPDSLGQVTGASQKQSGGTPFAARSFGYAYDNIGTRTSATFSGTTGNTHTIGYTKASCDGTQYASITTPGVALVSGEADPTASVTVNGVAAQARQSSHFAHELPLTNTNGPAAQAVDIAATIGTTTETEQRHAFVPAATTNLTYDLDGNLTFDGFLDYTWDAESRLLTVRTRPGLAPAGSSLKDFRQEMTYDHAGRRIQRTTYYTVGGIEHRATDDLFVYDGWNQIAVLDAATHLPRQTYVWGLDLSLTLQGAGGVGGLALIRDIPSSTNHFVSYDGNGNVVGLADAATGQQTADYVYDAFGNLLAAKGTFATRNSWRFSTKIQDEASGFYYYGFRYYDPITGTWVSRDPLGDEMLRRNYGREKSLWERWRIEQTALEPAYLYTHNDSINKVDRRGMDIYLTQGNSGAPWWQLGNRLLHQEICVDEWVPSYKPNENCCKGHDRRWYRKTGKRYCVSFGLIPNSGYGDPIYFRGPGWNWLDRGTPVPVGPGLTLGAVYETGDQGWKSIDTLSTNCHQDLEFKKKLQGMYGKRDKYELDCHNCRTFSQMMFDEATASYGRP